MVPEAKGFQMYSFWVNRKKVYQTILLILYFFDLITIKGREGKKNYFKKEWGEMGKI